MFCLVYFEKDTLMDDKKLINLIEKAAKDGITELDLFDKAITELPVEIGKLINLTTLSLDSNQLSRLPAQIGQLTNLTKLDLYNNQLSSLPAQIGQLTHLTKLDLYNNQLSSLPAEIGQLTKLTTLNLSRNQFSSLPVEIGQLTDLTTLDLCAVICERGMKTRRLNMRRQLRGGRLSIGWRKLGLICRVWRQNGRILLVRSKGKITAKSFGLQDQVPRTSNYG